MVQRLFDDDSAPTLLLRVIFLPKVPILPPPPSPIPVLGSPRGEILKPTNGLAWKDEIVKSCSVIGWRSTWGRRGGRGEGVLILSTIATLQKSWRRIVIK